MDWPLLFLELAVLLVGWNYIMPCLEMAFECKNTNKEGTLSQFSKICVIFFGKQYLFYYFLMFAGSILIAQHWYNKHHIYFISLNLILSTMNPNLQEISS